MTIEEGVAKWKPKAEEAARIGRGVTVSPAWLLELIEWRAEQCRRRGLIDCDLSMDWPERKREGADEM